MNQQHLYALPTPPKRKRRVKTDPPESFAKMSRDDRTSLRAWCLDNYPEYARNGRGGLVWLAAQCFDHHLAKGNKMVSWRAAVRTWVRNQPTYAPRHTNEQPRQQRPLTRDDAPGPMRDTLRDVLEHMEKPK